MTINLTGEVLGISALITLFLAIIGCYVYVFNSVSGIRKELEAETQNTRDELDKKLSGYISKLDSIGTSIANLQIALASRLARIETKLGIKEQEDGL